MTPLVQVTTGALAGALAPLRAAAIIHRRGLWGLVLAPIGVNLLAGTLLYAGLFRAGAATIDRLLPAAEGGPLIAALAWLVHGLLLLGLLLLVGWLMVRVGVVLGAPWYGHLSIQIEQAVGGRAWPEQPLTLQSAATDIGRALLFELKKLLLALAIGLPALLLNLIPAAGQILATVVAIGLGATIACLDFFDGPQERRRRGFRQKLALVRRALPASATFGLVALTLVSVPVLNLLAIPLCVAGGTLLVCAPPELLDPPADL